MLIYRYVLFDECGPQNGFILSLTDISVSQKSTACILLPC